jgi:hypothetical protein
MPVGRSTLIAVAINDGRSLLRATSSAAMTTSNVSF